MIEAFKVAVRGEVEGWFSLTECDFKAWLAPAGPPPPPRALQQRKSNNINIRRSRNKASGALESRDWAGHSCQTCWGPKTILKNRDVSKARESSQDRKLRSQGGILVLLFQSHVARLEMLPLGSAEHSFLPPLSKSQRGTLFKETQRQQARGGDSQA